jgi:hypothetical protein
MFRVVHGGKAYIEGGMRDERNGASGQCTLHGAQGTGRGFRFEVRGSNEELRVCDAPLLPSDVEPRTSNLTLPTAHRAPSTVHCLIVVAFVLAALRADAAIIVGGEAVRFDAKHAAQFSAAQLRGASPATLSGLARVAATPHGAMLVDFFARREFNVYLIEDGAEDGAGRAPQPGLATLLAVRDHSVVKSYDLILNPVRFTLPHLTTPLPNQAASATDLMAAAWGAELLHIYFYARGISLPHHERDDFQELWRAIAAELGFPALRHGEDEEREGGVVVIGSERGARGSRFEGRRKR